MKNFTKTKILKLLVRSRRLTPGEKLASKIVKQLILLEISSPSNTGIVFILLFLSSTISLASARLLLPNNVRNIGK